MGDVLRVHDVLRQLQAFPLDAPILVSTTAGPLDFHHLTLIHGPVNGEPSVSLVGEVYCPSSGCGHCGQAASGDPVGGSDG